MTITYPTRDRTLLDSRLQILCAAFIAACRDAGIDIIITQTHRSGAYQNQLYAQGRTAADLAAAGVTGVQPRPDLQMVTMAKAGKSPHEWTNKNGKPAARAFDIAINGRLDAQGNLQRIYDKNGNRDIYPLDLMRKAGQIGKDLGLEWGGDFKNADMPHFQLANWKTLPDA